MSFDLALRLTEILLALVFLQQSAEHLATTRDDWHLFAVRAALSILLLAGIYSAWAISALVVVGVLYLRRYQGPYNGGSDRMGLLILCCLCLSHLLPERAWQELAFGYLALQLVLSYVISGWVKIVNPDWRNGRALRDVFLFSAYPVSENLRGWADWPRLMTGMAWAVMLFELVFPLSLLAQPLLIAGLIIAASFHLANACLFGLNRFFWTWLAAYPAILWFQQRVFG